MRVGVGVGEAWKRDEMRKDDKKAKITIVRYKISTLATESKHESSKKYKS